MHGFQNIQHSGGGGVFMWWKQSKICKPSSMIFLVINNYVQRFVAVSYKTSKNNM